MLVLVDEDRPASAHERRGVSPYCIARRRIIEVDHLATASLGQLVEEVGLPNRSGALQQEQWLLFETSEREVMNSPLVPRHLSHLVRLLLSSPISRPIIHRSRE